jgi:hypothetical protein
MQGIKTAFVGLGGIDSQHVQQLILTALRLAVSQQFGTASEKTATHPPEAPATHKRHNKYWQYLGQQGVTISQVNLVMHNGTAARMRQMFWRRRAGKVYTASPAPAHQHRNTCVRALSRALSESLTSKCLTREKKTLTTPTHSLLLHLLHNISAPQSLPCIRKQVTPSSSHPHAYYPCLGHVRLIHLTSIIPSLTHATRNHVIASPRRNAARAKTCQIAANGL